MSDEAADFAQFAATMAAAPEAPAPVAPDAEAAKADAKPDEAKPTEAPKKDWTELAAKERERREARKAERAAQAQFRTEAEAAKAKAQELEELQALAAKDPLAVVGKLGLTLDQLNQKYVAKLDGAHDTERQALAAQVEQLKSSLDEMRAANEAARRHSIEAEKQAIESKRAETKANFFADIDAIAQQKPEFEIVARAPEGKEDLLNLLAAYKEEHGQQLDLQTALSVITEKLTAKYRPIAMARQFQTSTQKPASGISTLSSDMRQSEPRQASAADDEREFMNLALRLNNQQPA